MLEKINWSDKLKIGIEEIDLQHEYFTLLINRLIDEFAVSNDNVYLCRLLEELSLYASFHFISEENIMIKNNYPKFKDHLTIHRKLLSQLNDKINYFRLSKETIETIIVFLVDWFVQHSQDKDKSFGLYLLQG